MMVSNTAILVRTSVDVENDIRDDTDKSAALRQRARELTDGIAERERGRGESFLNGDDARQVDAFNEQIDADNEMIAAALQHADALDQRIEAKLVPERLRLLSAERAASIIANGDELRIAATDVDRTIAALLPAVRRYLECAHALNTATAAPAPHRASDVIAWAICRALDGQVKEFARLANRHRHRSVSEFAEMTISRAINKPAVF
jgi:hypothetical protein